MLGDLWFWNTTKSGYKLETSDDISFEYLSPSSVNTPSYGSSAQYGLYNIENGNDVQAGDFVNIYTNAGIPCARKADYLSGLKSHGYVIDNFIGGSIAMVFFGGINPSYQTSDNSQPNVGDSVYLSIDGKVTVNPDDTISDSCLQYLGYVVNQSSIYVEIEDAVIIN